MASAHIGAPKSSSYEETCDCLKRGLTEGLIGRSLLVS